MDYKRILTVQDISCVGQCSITVALPILSACGLETAVLPSAVLSTHTTGFDGFTFRDLSQDFPAIEQHWINTGITFDAVYTGYLGSSQQVEYVLSIVKNCMGKQGLTFFDPAMADNGVLYPGFDHTYVAAMKKLCSHGDYILPNITEACLLTDTVYKEQYDQTYIDLLLDRLTTQICPNVILTGVSFTPDTTGIAVTEQGNRDYYCHRRLPRNTHGTGDVFSAAFVGAKLRGKTALEAAKIAGDYTIACMEATADDPSHWYGVKFEPVLGQLIAQLNNC